MCVKGVKKIAYNVKVVIEEYRNQTIRDIAVLVSRTSQILVGLPTSFKVCVAAFKKDPETLLFASSLSKAVTCEQATMRYAVQVGSTLQKLENGSASN